MSRAGQVWKQTQSEDDDPERECVLVWLVLETEVARWDRRSHRVLILEASGRNWRDELLAGAVDEMDEPRDGWWEELSGALGRLERLA